MAGLGEPSEPTGHTVAAAMQASWEQQVACIDLKEKEVHQQQLRLFREQTACFTKDLHCLRKEVHDLRAAREAREDITALLFGDESGRESASERLRSAIQEAVLQFHKGFQETLADCLRRATATEQLCGQLAERLQKLELRVQEDWRPGLEQAKLQVSLNAAGLEQRLDEGLSQISVQLQENQAGNVAEQGRLGDLARALRSEVSSVSAHRCSMEERLDFLEASLQNLQDSSSRRLEAARTSHARLLSASTPAASTRPEQSGAHYAKLGPSVMVVTTSTPASPIALVDAHSGSTSTPVHRLVRHASPSPPPRSISPIEPLSSTGRILTVDAPLRAMRGAPGVQVP